MGLPRQRQQTRRLVGKYAHRAVRSAPDIVGRRPGTTPLNRPHEWLSCPQPRRSDAQLLNTIYARFSTALTSGAIGP